VVYVEQPFIDQPRTANRKYREKSVCAPIAPLFYTFISSVLQTISVLVNTTGHNNNLRTGIYIHNYHLQMRVLRRSDGTLIICARTHTHTHALIVII
jgi:hypothetical protein